MVRDRLATGLFVGAIGVALVVGLALRDTPGFAERTPDGSLHGDLEHYVYWTRLVTLGGIQAAYGGSWPETYAVYPPVTLYGYQLVGTLYQALQDPGRGGEGGENFDPDRAQASLWLRAALKAVALGWHLLAGLAIYLLVRRARGPTLAGLAGALYVANPAALFDVAHWGQPDGAHSLFAVLGVGSLAAGQDLLAWGSIALAALAKPQAWTLLPLALIATVRRGQPRRLAPDLAVALLVSLVVLSPFIATGHLRDLLTLPGTISSVMPVVSADAHNLWWLVFVPHSEDALTALDGQRLAGPLSFRAIAGLLVVTELGLTCWLYWTRRATLPEAAALGALGWFVFTTQAHENHLFFALPLLALAWPERRALLVVYAVLTLTLLLNMVLHDQLVLEAIETSTRDPSVRSLGLLNAGLNVACCLGWMAWASLRPAGATVVRDRATSILAVLRRRRPVAVVPSASGHLSFGSLQLPVTSASGHLERGGIAAPRSPPPGPMQRLSRPAGWVHHPGAPVLKPLDCVVQVGAASGESPLMLHFIYTDDGLYVPAVIRTPPGPGPFPALLSVHGGSGGLGVAYLVDHVLERGMVFDRLLAEGYVVCCTEGRMEHEDAYGTELPNVLDHLDVVQVFRYLQGLSQVDPHRVAIFGVNHGGEIQLKATSEMGGGPAALVAGEPAVIEYLGLRYAGPRKESNLQFRGPLGDDQIDFARAWGRVSRLPDQVPILILGREDDHLQGLFKKLHELLQRAGKRVEWATWDHSEHAYQWGPRRTPDGYAPDPVQADTLERVVAFLNEHVGSTTVA